MAEYKCISCGEIKESDKACSCPNCGYKMYRLPYDRRELLIKEIRHFIKRPELCEIKHEDLVYYRVISKEGVFCGTAEKDELEIIPKVKDEQRFPNFAKIRDYVCNAGKTEQFGEYLDTTIEQLRRHVHESFSQKYKTDLDRIRLQIENLDEVLIPALEVLGIKAEFETIAMPEIVLNYSEEPEPELVDLADRLLDELKTLSAKIQRFIKLNNIYGTAYQRKTKITFKPSEEKAYADDLNACIKAVSGVNARKYIVDIFSDGSDELGEMLKSCWNAIAAIMTLPLLRQNWVFVFPDGAIAGIDNVCEMLVERLHERYETIDDTINSASFLAEYNENSLFTLYNKMIELDSFGFMGIDQEGLIHIGESENKLNALVGLSTVKESIKKLKAYALTNKDSQSLNVHMCFYGNPGTGKTEVARIIAGILYENKILPTDKVIEADRSSLVSQYFGATAEKTSQVIAQAMGGVLFVDEAYALANNSEAIGFTDYGKEAIDTLVKAMEDYRGQFCVIFAGYKNEMQKMISSNPGMRSRIQFELDFPNYTREELRQIAALMLRKQGYTVAEPAMSRILDITDIKRKNPNFANAREVRNIIDQVIMCQNLRSVGVEDRVIGITDVNRYIQDTKLALPVSEDGEKKVLTGEEELENLIGLTAVKRMVRKIKAYAKRNHGQEDFNLHMCFRGNPGTGKTEVARILSRILYDVGVLTEAKLVETDSHGLLGRHVGETAPKTLAKINEATDGVLFVDEAYGLAPNGASSGGTAAVYGEEAVSVLLKEMEDRRGKFCVILAGYRNEMETMLSANPGLKSRIQFTLDFPDYTREELGEIALAFLKKKKYEIDGQALNRLLDVTEYYRNRPNFANARTVRNILDQVIMNQNLRTEDAEGDDLIIIDDVDDYLADEGIDLTKMGAGQRRIGFMA